MRYLEATVHQPEWMRHPMQTFIAESDAVHREELLSWTIRPDEAVEYVLFFVAGDVEPYRERIAAVDSVVDFSLTPIDDESFYAYVTQATRVEDVGWRSAFRELELVVIPPIVYDDDGTMHLEVLGDPEDLGTVVDRLPDEVRVEVDHVGEFRRPHVPLAGDLTDRQFEAVGAAVELGYYEVPRRGSVRDVAAELDCAASTASKHLQKAEATVMRRLVGR